MATRDERWRLPIVVGSNGCGQMGIFRSDWFLEAGATNMVIQLTAICLIVCEVFGRRVFGCHRGKGLLVCAIGRNHCCDI